MLTILRKNAVKIGWVIFIVFAGTMFTGSLLLFKNSHQDDKADKNQAVAKVGDIVVPIAKYMEFQQRILTQLQPQMTHRMLSPEQMERIQYDTYQQTLQHTLLLEGAKQAKVSISRSERDGALENLYKQLNIKNKRALKDLLKKNQIDYDRYMDVFEEDLLVQKLIIQLQGSATVSDKDVEDKYTQVNAQHILIADDPKSKESSEEKAMTILAKIRKKELTFEEAVARYSQDPGTKGKGGNLGWFGGQEMVPEFSQVAFALGMGEISEPIKTRFGTHIIRVNDKRGLPKPTPFDIEKERQEILLTRRQVGLDQFLANLTKGKEVKIFNTSLQAIDAKLRGKTQEAINAYQTLSSEKPENPIPDYFIAQVYLSEKNTQKAIESLKKAAIKGEIRPDLDLSYTHIALAKLDSTIRQKELEKALELAKNDLTGLETLQKTLEELGQPQLLAKTKARIVELGKISTK